VRKQEFSLTKSENNSGSGEEESARGEKTIATLASGWSGFLFLLTKPEFY
jgi:hypothetical protein